MWLRRSASRTETVLLWAGLALASFVAFRLILPPRPAAGPLFATAGLMLAAGVLYAARWRLFARSAAFLVVGAVAYLFAWNRGMPLLYAFSATCFGIVVVSHLLPRWALRRLEGRLAGAKWVLQGDSAALLVQVANPSATTVRMLELEAPVEGTLGDNDDARALLVQLAAGRERELTMRTPPLRRGRRFAGPLTVRTGFPLGLVSASETIAGTGQHIWVYPRCFDVQYVPITGEQFLDMGDAISPRSGGVEEFAGVREYRYGDSRRHVHWRASARRGELVVKEFMRPAAATVTIAVDLRASACIGEGLETTTEYAISAAASVARYALGSGHHVQLALGGETFQTMGPWRGLGAFEHVLRALALAEASGDVSPGSRLSNIASFVPLGSTVVMIYVDWQVGSLAGLAALQRRSILAIPVAIDAESFGSGVTGDSRAGLPSRARARRLRKGEDPAAAFRQ